VESFYTRREKEREHTGWGNTEIEQRVFFIQRGGSEKKQKTRRKGPRHRDQKRRRPRQKTILALCSKRNTASLHSVDISSFCRLLTFPLLSRNHGQARLQPWYGALPKSERNPMSSSLDARRCRAPPLSLLDTSLSARFFARDSAALSNSALRQVGDSRDSQRSRSKGEGLKSCP
jgi:hypothetical protein